jgi:hypothetical protein
MNIETNHNSGDVSIGALLETRCQFLHPSGLVEDVGAMLVTDEYDGKINQGLQEGWRPVGKRAVRLSAPRLDFPGLGIWVPRKSIERGLFMTSSYNLFFERMIPIGSDEWLQRFLESRFSVSVEEIMSARSSLRVDNQ